MNSHNLALSKDQWCSATGKVWCHTGHASQTLVVYPPTGSRPR